MPYGNGAGPNNFGPRTGRGMGYCSGYNAPGYANQGGGYGGGFGMGFRHGRGGGFGGFGRGQGFGMDMRGFGGYAAPINPVNEKEYLKSILAASENETKAIKERLEELNLDNSAAK
jgi:uncharacterized protein DUF5320